MTPSSAGPAYAERLRAAAAPLLDRARGLRQSSALYAAPDAETWSAIKVLAHVAEFVPYWAREARTVAASTETPAFGRTHDDGARIAAVADHADDPLARAIGRLDGALADAEEILTAIPADAWGRRGRHPRRGEMTIAEIIDTFVLGHLDEHCRQLDEIGLSSGERRSGA